jgi:hypothetical protein
MRALSYGPGHQWSISDCLNWVVATTRTWRQFEASSLAHGAAAVPMFWLFNFLVYLIVYSFLLAATANFFVPIALPVAAFLLVIASLVSTWSALFIPLHTFWLSPQTVAITKKSFYICIIAFLAWGAVAIYRPTTESDATGYHLPLSLLMNKSVWYPGISKLSSHFGFPNGTSVVASLFTSVGILSLENIPNLILWAVLGMGTFLFLVKKQIAPRLACSVALVTLLSPDMFWQSYNMGTDLPCACFLAFGLVALAEDNVGDSYLFLALSAAFKTIGLLALVIGLPYLLFRWLQRKTGPNGVELKVILGTLIVGLSLLRTYIATGNPVYPSLALDLAPWGISSELQRTIIARDLTSYSGVEYTPAGILFFVTSLFVFPHKFQSSHWFSPLFLAAFALSLYAFLREKHYQRLDGPTLYVTGLLALLSLAWFLYSPLVRFILGALIFVTLKQLIFIHSFNGFAVGRVLVRGSILITLGLFVFNVARHVYEDVVPVIKRSPAALDKFMPWVTIDSTKYILQYTSDGFPYSKSATMLCHKMEPPCISRRSLAGDDFLIAQFRKHNKM